MRVVIAGCRYKDVERKIEFDDYSLVVNAIKSSGYDITEVVCGTAIGVDTLGERWAIAHDISVKYMPADWNKNGKAAGPIRNRDMAIYADAAVIVWDGVSDGTRNMIDCMIRVKKPYHIGMTTSNLESFF